MSRVVYDVEYSEQASRLELFLRMILGFAYGFVWYFWTLLSQLTSIVQFFHILILGKRNERLFEFVKNYMRFTTEFFSYTSLLTDERPSI